MENDLIFYTCYEVPGHTSKKNSRPIHVNRRSGKVRIGKPSKLISSENIHLLNLLKARNQLKEFPLKTNNKNNLRAEIFLHFPHNTFYTKKSKFTKMSETIGDNSNLSQIIEDSLQKAQVIHNDSILNPVTIEKRPNSTGRYMVEIKLYRIDV